MLNLAFVILRVHVQFDRQSFYSTSPVRCGAGLLNPEYSASSDKMLPVIIEQEIPMSSSANVRKALLVRLEAKPGKESAVEQFLKGGLAIVNEEPGSNVALQESR